MAINGALLRTGLYYRPPLADKQPSFSFKLPDADNCRTTLLQPAAMTARQGLVEQSEQIASKLYVPPKQMKTKIGGQGGACR